MDRLSKNSLSLIVYILSKIYHSRMPHQIRLFWNFQLWSENKKKGSLRQYRKIFELRFVPIFILHCFLGKLIGNKCEMKYFCIDPIKTISVTENLTKISNHTITLKNSFHSPMQTRGPSPKGKNVYGLSFCLFSSENLSGLNLSGSG